ncbi:1-aminocyclopropane-1-carboxylate deaminase/D-cysteine desulfhydrase [Pendulispora albinea]|uniref:Pyridoxal-phosphate dependent enzyme n=1 Tax=Pendulispora albinea TaxID=2741071 RepID=A0ABZ2LTJ7_9BACT
MELNPNYPTPVEHLPRLSRVPDASSSARACDARRASHACQLWVKREDVTHPLYGGNKVRKLERLLAVAKARAADRIVTVGAGGSHQVLATALFGRQAGFEVEAVLLPQPRSDHALLNLRASLAQGAHVFPVSSYAAAPLAIVRRLGRDALFIPVGGSNYLGTLGYVDAAREIAEQIRSGAMPEPDVAVVTLGSGGTAAGLAAGFAAAGLKTEVLGVAVTPPGWGIALMARWLAWRCGHLAIRFRVTSRYLGAGYGHRTAWGDRATALAQGSGLTLDPTYTAKTFAAVLDLVDSGRYRHVLYVHTLSSAPMAPLLAGAPEEQELAPELVRLFR